MAAPPKQCIYCGATERITSEHVWGEWIKQFVPPLANKHHDSIMTIPRPFAPEPPTLRLRAGNPANAQVERLCWDCNTTWGSQIQERAKHHLVPLFAGDAAHLDANAQAAIAAWITMATMTGEYMVRPSDGPSIPQAHRNYLRLSNSVPNNWRIWIGHCDEWIVDGFHNQWALASFLFWNTESPMDGAASDDDPPNTQTTAFKIGSLYVFVLSSALPGVAPEWRWWSAPRARVLLQQVWPITNFTVKWPAGYMTNDDAETFSTAFVNYADHLRRLQGFG